MNRPLVIRSLAVLLSAVCCPAAIAQSVPINGSLTKRLGAGYAAMINFAENPDIATAHYYIDDTSAEDPTLHVVRLNWEHEFKTAYHGWSPTVQVTTPYLNFDAAFDLGTNGTVNTKWTAVGAILMTGARRTIGDHLSISPSLAWGLVRLKNTADYAGNVGVLEPILKGIVLDWTSDAWLIGGALGVDYERDIGTRSMLLHAGIAHNFIETFDSVDGFVEFSSYATTLNLRGEIVHPTSLRIKGNPLSLVTQLGGTSFAGPYRDELGFAYFVDAGLALEVDLSDRAWVIESLRLGVKGIAGEDVVGWSTILSWAF